MKTKMLTNIRRAGRSAIVVLGLAAVVASAQVKIPVQDPAAHDVRAAPGF
jgi:hypothetical protein